MQTTLSVLVVDEISRIFSTCTGRIQVTWSNAIACHYEISLNSGIKDRKISFNFKFI